ncbi:hypothetical protein CR3_gp228 [Cronobacter phage CR3]|uniref:Uncharacterized protein n=1 Tax=Cronobacter phage CR3 TaxID=1162295 RepID=I1TRS0_9CAUD|nr:hypothetical protein CR3_gp228 [Cronobacter phage CR3]AFH21393.1 hypothetical protein CR3_228 [Cronobacter phage CR3]KAB3178402.1 hypothetical protein F9047_10655 [Escherichia coli]
MRLLTIDQSLSSCAYVVLEDGIPIFKEVLHTTGSEKKAKDSKGWCMYFEHTAEQIAYITGQIAGVCDSFDVDHIVLESLSLGSVGDATRDLAGLFYSIQLTLLRDGYTMDQIHVIAPTSVKSWARKWLPGEEQETMNDAGTKMVKVKMGKNEMMRVCEILHPGFLKGYNKSGKNGGATDLADAILIGGCFLERNGERLGFNLKERNT